MPREELFKIYLKIHWKSVMCSVWNLFGNQFENRFENTLENLHANMFGNPFRNTFQNSFRYSFRFFSEVIRKLFGWDNVITWRRRSRRCSSIRNILCTLLWRWFISPSRPLHQSPATLVCFLHSRQEVRVPGWNAEEYVTIV